ncbi:MAG: DUF488 domain-containing protein [Candidatus Altiarchaeota archaeon]|nr:DUF488 domain-containing protein [Candidatus Altiarchaeota archaeon]MBU4341640.1 DUF488 domain-containing protein [Candidatus Altiarchaeota archaeon]MBU4406847.1 DUF488 domain-containing protein [Candidatus Altiarchaeota archaeon]MBU4437825.1 DUF488 domain-containing protein [Candidatus Altiarchaeota archaeon]
MDLYTIGFTKKTANEFFEILKKNEVEQIADIRLNNTSQLAAFTKKDDLEYFLDELCDIDYYHFDFLAPTKEIRDEYNEGKDWDRYTETYVDLLDKREILKKLDRKFFEKRTCFLCSESSPEYCHRRLLVEYLKRHWKDVEIIHL